MGLGNLPGLSEEDVKAAEVLGVLKKSHPEYKNASNSAEQNGITLSNKRRRNDSIDGCSTNSSGKEENRKDPLVSRQPDTLLNRMVSNVVTFYDDFNDRKRVGSIAKLLDDAYEDNYTSSEDDKSKDDEEEDDEEKDDDYDEDNGGDNYSTDSRVSKRRKFSEALAKSRDNFKEYKLSMSIESKKRLITCLHLLKLANKQLSDKVTNLQAMVKEEEEASKRRRRRLTGPYDIHSTTHQSKTSNTKYDTDYNAKESEESENEVKNISTNNETKAILEAKKRSQDECYDGGGEDDEEFFDAFDSNDFDEKSTIIKMEVVGTIKKVYSLISRYTGDSLPEPARSQVRESLLNLPTNWFLSANGTFSTEPNTVSTTDTSNSSRTSSAADSPIITEEEDMANQNLKKTVNRGRSASTTSVGPDNSNLSANGKVLILAKESLDMVQNVMDVVDSTLGKAEEWVKQRQEVKEMFLRTFLGKQGLNEHENVSNSTDSDAHYK